MKAVLYKKGGRDNALFTEVPDPVCGPEDVLIRVYASAICKPADFCSRRRILRLRQVSADTGTRIFRHSGGDRRKGDPCQERRQSDDGC